MKILLIEDDKGLRTGISFVLSQEGYEVWEAGTAREGYALFKREQPKAVLMDLNLPDMDGTADYKGKEVALNRLKAAKRAGKGTKVRL